MVLADHQVRGGRDRRVAVADDPGGDRCGGEVPGAQAPRSSTTNYLTEGWQEREWSPAAFAERLGVSRQTVIFIERSRFDPSLPLAFRLVEVFGCRNEERFVPEDRGESQCRLLDVSAHKRVAIQRENIKSGMPNTGTSEGMIPRAIALA